MSATTTIRIPGNDQFRRAYAELLDRQLLEVEAALAALGRSPQDGLAQRVAVRLLQQMEASSGPWGFAAVGRAAASLKGVVRACAEGPSAAEVLRLESPLHVQEMRRALGRRPSPPERSECRLLLAIEAPGAAPDALGGTLRRYGYDVRAFPTAEAAGAALAETRPVAVLIDLPYAEALDALEALRRTGTPLLVVTDRADVAARIQAVRAGADGLYARSSDVGALLDRLDRMTTGAAPDPYRVLVVDDDEITGEIHASALRRAGMRVARVSDPLAVMGPLRELSPDLILLDMELGACSGQELAAALRQQDEFVGTPIVFLSSIDEIDRQLEARSVGAEDFLVKPIGPARLVAEVSLRAGRARSLRAHMLRDGQTGLLNAAALSTQLRHEVERARRQGQPICYAKIQIDGLEALNASAGQGAGDRVVRTLARLLQHRLRRTDLAGRAGGDSFGLVLLDCDGAVAVRVLEGLAASFAELRHETTNGPVTATFSAGVAAFPGYPEAGLLQDAADKALLRAQREGGGRILRVHP